jgi:hypothetical protein
MEITYLGSAICSYNLLIRSAILKVTVPATIITSDWRGDGLGNIPNRSRSYPEAKVDIISIAQQAIPKPMGQREDNLAQLMTSSAFAMIMPPDSNL